MAGNSDRAAFPGVQTCQHEDFTPKSEGLTKREWFTGMALMGYVAQNDCQDVNRIAELSVEQADAALAALQEGSPNGD